MRVVTAASLCVMLAACGTIEQAPNARPLSQANIETIGATKLSITGDEQGVGKSWYYTRIDGSGQGLIGVLAGAVAEMVINSGPSSRARHQADELAKFETPELIDSSLLSHLKAATGQSGSAAAPGVIFPEVVLTQKILTPGTLDDTLEVTTTYTLSENSSVLRVVATATYANKAIPYLTPYTFKTIPAAEKTGPLYRNTFTYYSTPLPVPTLTPELKGRLVANIEDSMRDAAGNLPDPKSNEYKAMKHEIDQANDDKLTPNEISVFLTREWLKNDAAMVKAEVEQAHAFISKYVVMDINRTTIPSLEGVDELIETGKDQRTVRRIGHGVESGSYVSSASELTTFATYGNAVAVGKATLDTVKARKDQAAKKDKKA